MTGYYRRQAMGSNSDNLLQVLAKNFDVLALPLVTLVYPLYASVKAIETRTNDQQWLTYWVLYSMITLIEITFSKILESLPIWPYAKLIMCCWLVLPHFNGAAHFYRRFIRPFYMNPQFAAPQIWSFPPQKKRTFKKQDDILTAAENEIRAKDEREEMQRHINHMGFHDVYRY